jgi:uroporphyrinogen-III synthase
MNPRPEGRDFNPAEGLDLALLNRVAFRISTATQLDRALAEIVEFVASVVRCDSCFVYLLEGDAFVLHASKNPGSHLADRLKLSLAQGTTGWVAELREPAAVGQLAYKDPRFKCFNDLPEDKFEAFLSVPMISSGRLAGVINVQNRDPYIYSPREISLVSTVGFMGAAEVAKSRLECESSALSERLATRKVIERAKGILQRDLKLDEQNAYRALQRESQHRRKSMKEIAEVVVLIENLKDHSV